jgi:hypothetical protein
MEGEGGGLSRVEEGGIEGDSGGLSRVEEGGLSGGDEGLSPHEVTSSPSFASHKVTSSPSDKVSLFFSLSRRSPRPRPPARPPRSPCLALSSLSTSPPFFLSSSPPISSSSPVRSQKAAMWRVSMLQPRGACKEECNGGACK